MSKENKTIEELLQELEEACRQPVHILLMCSGFNVVLHKNNILGRLPANLYLHNGPACPACLTGSPWIDQLAAYTRRGNVVIAVYNDVLGLPGTVTSLEKVRTAGADIRVVASLWDALLLAKKNRRKRIVFPALGFESAAASTAAAILQAKVAGIFNFQVFMGHKRMLACMETALQNKLFPVNGFITSGRVAASMGSGYFYPLTEKFGVPQAISGYQPENLLQAILAVVKQTNHNRHKVENLFPEAVSPEGNPKSHQLLEEVFDTCDTFCNGWGMVQNAGFRIKNSYRMFDAEKVFFDTEIPQAKMEKDRLCSEMMRGNKKPSDCPHFKTACNPVQALGACMHSAEGPCRMAYLYEKKG